MKLIVSVAILVLGTATLGSAQWRHQNYQQFYPQQRPYQNRYYNPNDGQTYSTSDAEWVCKNPKTGDMMLIVSEEVPAGNGQGQWPHPHHPKGQPVQPVQPDYPNYPQQPNNPPTQPQIYPTQPAYPPTQAPPQDTTPNTGGEGVIDIRFGNN